jgi:hypothetical protein
MGLLLLAWRVAHLRPGWTACRLARTKESVRHLAGCKGIPVPLSPHARGWDSGTASSKGTVPSGFRTDDSIAAIPHSTKIRNSYRSLTGADKSYHKIDAHISCKRYELLIYGQR